MDCILDWNDFLNTIKSRVNGVSYNTWFKDTKLSKITEDSVYIEVPMTFHKNYLKVLFFLH